MKRKSVIISILIVVVLIFGTYSATALFNGNSTFLNEFKRFSVTIENQSDFDIVKIETGIMQSHADGKTDGRKSTVIHEVMLESGSDITIKPDLQLKGEGIIYLKFTDSRGETTEKIICSYTETLSGYSKLTINNSSTQVLEKCS